MRIRFGNYRPFYTHPLPQPPAGLQNKRWLGYENLSVGWEISKTTFEGVTETPRAASKTHLLSEKEDAIVSLEFHVYVSGLFVAFVGTWMKPFPLSPSFCVGMGL